MTAFHIGNGHFEPYPHLLRFIWNHATDKGNPGYNFRAYQLLGGLEDFPVGKLIRCPDVMARSMSS